MGRFRSASPSQSRDRSAPINRGEESRSPDAILRHFGNGSPTRPWRKAGCAWSHKASKASIIPAVFFSRRWGDLHALQDQLPLVLDDPLHDLSALKLHRAGHGGGKVDVPLLALLALDQLDLGGVAQRRTSCSVV